MPRASQRTRETALPAACGLESVPLEFDLEDVPALSPDYQLGNEVWPPPSKLQIADLRDFETCALHDHR